MERYFISNASDQILQIEEANCCFYGAPGLYQILNLGFGVSFCIYQN